MTRGWSWFVRLVPTLIAAYPVALVSTANLDELAPLDLVIAGIVYGAMGAAVHALVALAAQLTRPRLAASTVAAVAGTANAVLFCAVMVAERVSFLRFRYTVALLVALGVLTVWRLWRVGGDRPGVARALTLTTIGVYLALLGESVRAKEARRRITTRLQQVAELTAPIRRDGAPVARPDIYLFLLDAYASPRVLDSVFGVRNDAFRDSLRSLGFIIPELRTNYSSTAAVLASTLNLAYLDSLAPIFDGRTVSLGPLYHLIHNDRTTQYLARLGYELYFVPSLGWAGTRMHSRARVHLTTPETGIVRGTIERSVLLYALWPHTLIGRILPMAAPRPGLRGVALAAFSGTREIMGAASPKFVLAHSMLTHYPFLVDEECRLLPHPLHTNEQEGAEGFAAYTDAVRCTDRQVLALVTEILKQSATPPILIVQSDHGPRSLGMPFHGDASAVTPIQVAERMQAFGAYYLPGGRNDVLADTTTPINAMRAILSHYLAARLPPLPDRHFHSTEDRPYYFAPIPRTMLDAPLSGASHRWRRSAGEP